MMTQEESRYVLDRRHKHLDDFADGADLPKASTPWSQWDRMQVARLRGFASAQVAKRQPELAYLGRLLELFCDEWLAEHKPTERTSDD